MTSKQPALVLASGGFNGKLAKTAFGLIRSSERFQIVGVLDPEQAGQEAGQIVDGKDRRIGIYQRRRSVRPGSNNTRSCDHWSGDCGWKA